MRLIVFAFAFAITLALTLALVLALVFTLALALALLTVRPLVEILETSMTGVVGAMERWLVRRRRGRTTE